MARYSSTRSSASTTRSKSARIEDVVTRSRTARLAAVAQLNHGTNLTDLPHELLLMVCLYLNPTDIAKLRREHRKLAAAGIEHIVSEIILNVTESSFQKLEAIARHPVISRHVTSILWEADCLPSLGCVFWEVMLRSLEKTDAWRALGANSIVDGDTPGAIESDIAMQILFDGPQHQYSQVQIDEAWINLQTLSNEQAQLLDFPNCVQRMATALKQFPKLKHLTMSTRNTYNVSSNRDAREHKAYGPSFSLLSRGLAVDIQCGVTQALCLLIGAYQTGTQLKTFECGSVDWRLLEQGPELFAIMKRAVSNVREMDMLLHFNVGGSITLGEITQVDIDEGKRFLATGRLRDFVTSAPYLRSLGIGFEWGRESCPTNLDNIVGRFHWPHLRSVWFERITAAEDDMVEFFSRHAKTLKELQLYHLQLSEGEHLSLFGQMRSILKGLEVVDLRGKFGIQSDVGRAWDFGDHEAEPSLNKIRVQDFILGQGDITSIDDLGSESYVL